MGAKTSFRPALATPPGKGLKKGKARDPFGFVNDIFKPGVAGTNLIDGLLILFNEIKKQQKVPKIFCKATITSFFKGKGDKNDMNNERGVFGVTIFRYILDRLIYNDSYETIDKNLTDCNVGARKERNHQDNLFVIYGVINSVMNGELEDVDLTLYDVVKCFDKIWLQEAISDLFEAGLDNDKLVLLYNENESCTVSVKTSYGPTSDFDLEKILMQGTVKTPRR